MVVMRISKELAYCWSDSPKLVCFPFEMASRNNISRSTDCRDQT